MMNGQNNYKCGGGFVWVWVFSGQPNYDGSNIRSSYRYFQIKNPNRRNMSVPVRVKMYKCYQCQPLSSMSNSNNQLRWFVRGCI